MGWKVTKVPRAVKKTAFLIVVLVVCVILVLLYLYTNIPLCYHKYMVVFFLFLFGLIVGSFLNVVIYRLPRKESIVYPPSHCPHCRHKLAWFDLIPVISYVLLQGKCRYCHTPISTIYPLVELITGLGFVFLYLVMPGLDGIFLIYLLIMACIFIIIFFTDLLSGIIPFHVILIGCITVVTYLLYLIKPYQLVEHLFSAIGAFLTFLLLFIITKGKGMGFGDVILVFMMGLFLGFPNIAIALYIAFLTGALISLILVLIGSKRLRHDTIPFGPFLVIGTFISLLYSDEILRVMHFYLPI